MRTKTMGRVNLLASALAILIFAPGAMAQDAPATKPPTKRAVPTVAEAKKFLDEAEQRYLELTNKAQRAQWSMRSAPSPVPGPGGIFREDTQAPPPQKTQLPVTPRSGARPVSRKRRA